MSFTTRANERSQRVMTKLGLTRDPSRDFEHPLVGDWDGAPHVLYAIDRAAWLSHRSTSVGA
ncbi:hypothetical protein GCM10025868_04430 [Angustibacter aerolatus]|uniref:N-acetyltransferase domain-containing protein n=1 Tax=Angustibacter aerolatus TaxID=1162965 RepID=A0ABQ6JAK0_9ACTN|nr:hypothetical protein GCM10025868_04430 [Angustibacter aerolatus]